MDQFDLNRLKSSFSSLIEGKKTGKEEYDDLKALLANYPYCQPLHIIHAASKKDNLDEFDQNLSKAAVYTPDRNILYKFIFQEEQFYQPITENTDSGFPDEKPDSNLGENKEQITVQGEETETVIEEVPQETEETVVTEPEIDEVDVVIKEEEEPVPSNNEIEHPKETEIINRPEEPPIFDNIASSDYFTFNKSTVDPLSKLQEEKDLSAIPEQETETAFSDSPIKGLDQGTVEEVSKYHDEELPYTFLWWLQKTRKEHAHTYQPYANLRPQASEALRKTSVDELNHQIIENIFHLQVPIEHEKAATTSGNTIEFELKHQAKKDYLIERFIKEEPQIRPPKAEKIDTENKARKSSEDNLDLVSETLAHIYIEQMLYHKAIDTYRKLSLKFPEKSAYFADQINEIQKKIS